MLWSKVEHFGPSGLCPLHRTNCPLLMAFFLTLPSVCITVLTEGVVLGLCNFAMASIFKNISGKIWSSSTEVVFNWGCLPWRLMFSFARFVEQTGREYKLIRTNKFELIWTLQIGGEHQKYIQTKKNWPLSLKSLLSYTCDELICFVGLTEINPTKLWPVQRLI
jgi:hypothetical protein